MFLVPRGSGSRFRVLGSGFGVTDTSGAQNLELGTSNLEPEPRTRTRNQEHGTRNCRLISPRDDAGDHPAFEIAFSAREDLEGANKRDEFTRLEQKRGIGWLSARRLSACEGLVDEHAARMQRMHQLREQRAMQVMRDDDQIEHVSLQEGLAIFEIDSLRPDREPSSRCLLTQLIERRTISIHPQRLVSLFSKPECVAAGSTRQVESITTRRQQMTMSDEPAAWIVHVRLAFAIAWPATHPDDHAH